MSAAAVCMAKIDAMAQPTALHAAGKHMLANAVGARVTWPSLPSLNEPWAAPAIAALGHDGDPQPFEQCVVVGSSPILLNSGLGAEIDAIAASDGGAVWRFGFAPTRGYEADVGHSTTCDAAPVGLESRSSR